MRRLALAMAVFWVALGCSGGGGGSGSGSAAASQGPILGFGSIFVGGDRWTTNGATFFRDGVAVSQDDLALGMVVRVEGSRNSDGSGRADRIFFDNEVKGPISSISGAGPDQLHVVVFGLTVVVDRGRTVIQDTTFDALSVGDYIEASGLPSGPSTLLATFLEDKGTLVLGVSRVELSGIVANAQPGPGTFQVRGTTVVVNAPGIVTEVDPRFAPFVENGDFVDVEGVLDGAGRVLAHEVDREDDFLDDDFDDFEVEGIVTDFVSLADFMISGIPIDASGAIFIPNRPDLVENGARVEVEGSLVGGVLIADEVKLRGSEVRIHAEIAADVDVDVAGGSFLLLGVPVVVPDSLEMKDSRDDVVDFGLDDLGAGDFLEVRGFEDGAGGVLATEIERDDSDDVRLRGRVDAFDAVAGTVEILGVVVPTNGATEFENELDQPITRAAFFAQVEVGSFVQVDDDFDANQSSIDVANEVEFELEDDSSGF